VIASLPGEVRITRPASGALRLLLAGSDAAGHAIEVAFAAPNAPPLPDLLHDVRVDRVTDGTWCIVAQESSIEIAAASVHVHRDCSVPFAAAVPPRHAPLAKRLFWRLVLALALSGFGRRLLLTLRSR
jgi:hypothetical protein